MFVWIYRISGKPVPRHAHYPLSLILWKPLRKFLNVVVIPNLPFSKLRILLYRSIGYKIGKNVFIGMKCYLDDMEPQLISIGDDVTISYCVKFCIHGKNQSHTPLIIKSGAYIGMGALLVSGKTGITIGENSIVGAGSVVVQSLPSHSVAVGVPATVIRSNK